jgi:hypothetical protein
MLCLRPIHDGAWRTGDQKFSLWSLFFGAIPLYRTRLPFHQLFMGEDPPPRSKRRLHMKKLSVVIAGSGQIRDVEIQPGTSAGDILHQLDLPDYLLSKRPNEPFFAATESVYDKVKDGEKIFASTKAEVGEAALCA